ncbi:acyloxyacyl hydrolase [Celeribacter indicus]|uniref:Lipid A 3-O-deacylase (PagL) n=1 Tax=Celeribacter indicus TaxID=1208324 RepID=A0A0B5DXK1_9RHOB|nr:acyloxyacyl hydrolase [Celeribacter indicus]AJE45481.1 Lipid A 3-O-deacylase (PagL) [Celeribacter indicus]SDW87922.1 Lipid A 3-O-deacylase (PagL) [Celeribacter indicus]
MGSSVIVALFLASIAHEGWQACHSPGGCFGRVEETPVYSFAAGPMRFEEEFDYGEVYLRYGFDRRYGPFQPIVGLSYADTGNFWAGFGGAWNLFDLDGFYGELSVMAGLYDNSGDADLGSALEFRSGLELGYEWDNGVRLGLSVDHRSNANTASDNPGMETVLLRVSVPVR